MNESPPPRRLAILTSQAFSLANFRGPLITELVARGVHVLALAPDFDATERKRVSELGAEPIDIVMSRAGLDPLHDMRALLTLARRLRRLNVDACLSYFIKPVIYGTLAAALARVPRRVAMIEGLGYAFADDAPKPIRLAAQFMYRLALPRAHTVIFLNAEDKALFLRQGLVQAAQTCAIRGIGVDLTHWSAVSPAPTFPVFILIARLLREKGVTDYVDAARLLRQSHPSIRFLLVGGVDENPHSLQHADVQRWHDEGIIEWAGAVADVRPLLSEASVFVLPSYYREGVPRSLQEALAMGRAVITTDLPGCRDTVIDGVNGFFTPPRDPAALAAIMQRFIDQPALIDRMGRASRALAEERFDVRLANRQIMHTLGIDD